MIFTTQPEDASNSLLCQCCPSCQACCTWRPTQGDVQQLSSGSSVCVSVYVCASVGGKVVVIQIDATQIVRKKKVGSAEN